jgi:hypothetical protein
MLFQNCTKIHDIPRMCYTLNYTTREEGWKCQQIDATDDWDALLYIFVNTLNVYLGTRDSTWVKSSVWYKEFIEVNFVRISSKDEIIQHK